MKNAKIFLFFAAVSILLVLSSCQSAENRIKEEIEKANYCNTKDDCVLAGSECPFGCYIYVNVDEAERITRIIDNFESRCIYSCISCPDVECSESKCVPVCG